MRVYWLSSGFVTGVCSQNSLHHRICECFSVVSVGGIHYGGLFSNRQLDYRQSTNWRELDKDWLAVHDEQCGVDGRTGRAASGHSLQLPWR